MSGPTEAERERVVERITGLIAELERCVTKPDMIVMLQNGMELAADLRALLANRAEDAGR